MKYFIFPLNQFGVSPTTYMMLPMIKDAFMIFGRPEPEYQKEYGKFATALWSEDQEVEVALENAANYVEEDLRLSLVDGHKPYRTTTDLNVMKEMLHGPLKPE